ncbi:MAG TPA: S8 family serine peptidase [Thermoleophilaceae bacterium]|nr:S8 family serine peptidase [Thermoleophilaceae bacterium]
MRRRLSRALAAAALAALAAPAAQAAVPRHTDRWLVLLEHAGHATAPAKVERLLDRTGMRRAGPAAPGLGVLTLKGPRPAVARLRRDPAVAHVSREWVRELRRIPNDFAVASPEGEYAVLPGTPIQWALARQGFPAAWDVTTGAGARVAVLDTGIDASHPELSGKILSAESVDGSDPRVDEDGHGTHVSGLACAATDDGRGVAGAGWGCGLHVVKLGRDLRGGIPDANVVRGLDLAIARKPHAINMSFGGGPDSPVLDAAIQTAFDRGIVLVAAAANDGEEEGQGAPASLLQRGDGANLDAGRGLVVTAADFEDTRAGTGRGPGISLAAYGLYDETRGPPGLISTYPGAFTVRDTPACSPLPLPNCTRRELGGLNAYAYLEGTSMAAPQVAALAALVGSLNPRLTTREKLRIIKETAAGSGEWNPDLGWGILNAAAAIDLARRMDRLAPSSRVRVVERRGRRVRLRFLKRDPGTRRGLIPTGVTRIELFGRRGGRPVRRLRRYRGTRKAVTIRLRPGRWRLYTRATDAAGNAELTPRRPDVRFRVRQRHR